MIRALLSVILCHFMAFAQGISLDEFKREIGYEKASKKFGYLLNKSPEKTMTQSVIFGANASIGMAGPWPDMQSIPMLNRKWHISEHSITESNDIICESWTLSKEKEEIRIDCNHYVSCQKAHDDFLRRIQFNVHSSIFHRATKQSIGALSARMGNEIIVWNYNYIIAINTGLTNVDFETIADWMNSWAESKVVQDVTPFRPTPIKVVISPEKPHVGDEVSIKIDMPNSENLSRYVFLPKPDSRMWTPIDFPPMAEIAKARKTGDTVFRYTIIDKQTMQFYKGEIVIQILPPLTK